MGRPKKEDSIKKTASDYKTIHVNVTLDQAEVMLEMGGPKKFLDELWFFWYRNFSLYEEQQLRDKSVAKKVKRLKQMK